MKRRIRTAAFTLIEIMIVVVILGLLASILMPKILDKPEEARRTKAKTDLHGIQTALVDFKIDTGRFPTTAEGLQALIQNPGIEGYDPDGYLEKVPLDPWKNPYVYLHPSAHSRDYDLESYGRDGEDGGSGDAADVESWNLD